jgi:phosphoribosylanthranilate isomerase
MPLKTLVKVGSLTNLSDARYCAGMDVQMLGFQAVPELPRHISAMKFQEIRGWISGPKIVAEAHGVQSKAQLMAIIESYRPDYLELGTAELHFIDNPELPVILKLQPGESWNELTDSLHSAKKAVAYALVEPHDDQHLPVPKIVVISSLDEAQKLLAKADANGIALQGSDEFSPGLKSYDTLAPILELLEDDF